MIVLKSKIMTSCQKVKQEEDVFTNWQRDVN